MVFEWAQFSWSFVSEAKAWIEKMLKTTMFLQLARAVGAGLLVGIGSALGGGCTSGHGVCGCARLSPRSLVFSWVSHSWVCAFGQEAYKHRLDWFMWWNDLELCDSCIVIGIHIVTFEILGLNNEYFDLTRNTLRLAGLSWLHLEYSLPEYLGVLRRWGRLIHKGPWQKGEP